MAGKDDERVQDAAQEARVDAAEEAAAENKTQRVQLLMAPSELEAIDDWGFANRIRTRAEAIRQLCAIGLTVDQKIERITQLVRELMDLSTARAKITYDNAYPDIDTINEYRRRLFAAEDAVVLKYLQLTSILGRLQAWILTMKRSKASLIDKRLVEIGNVSEQDTKELYNLIQEILAGPLGERRKLVTREDMVRTILGSDPVDPAPKLPRETQTQNQSRSPPPDSPERLLDLDDGKKA